MFVVEDERHAEVVGRFGTHAEATTELRRLAMIAWDEAPNAPPCRSWKTCGRTYEVIEYDITQTPWREVSRTPALDISAGGVRWL